MEKLPNYAHYYMQVSDAILLVICETCVCEYESQHFAVLEDIDLKIVVHVTCTYTHTHTQTSEREFEHRSEQHTIKQIWKKIPISKETKEKKCKKDRKKTEHVYQA